MQIKYSLSNFIISNKCFFQKDMSKYIFKKPGPATSIFLNSLKVDKKGWGIPNLLYPKIFL